MFNFFGKFKSILSQEFENLLSDKYLLDKNQYESLLTLIGKLHIERVENIKKIHSLKEVEFKVFSQFGVDGIIQYLINKIKIPNEIFIEFGASDYLESNTRFLLMNNNWKGLIIDGSKEYIDFIKKDRIYYRHQLTAIQSFITKDNINDLIKSNIKIKDIGLLSIDIDGNDYWVWKEINAVRPIIVICEYNNLFGWKDALVVPYQKNFVVYKAHYSCLYFGTSIRALVDLAQRKGYDFIGCDSEGVDAIFVRKEFSRPFKKVTVKEGFVEGKFRISRDKQGNFNYLDREQAIYLISQMKAYDLNLKKLVPLKNYKLE